MLEEGKKIRAQQFMVQTGSSVVESSKIVNEIHTSLPNLPRELGGAGPSRAEAW